MESRKSISKLLKKYPEIRELRFFKFSFKNKVQDRIDKLSNEEKIVIKKSHDYKINNNCSFWEAYIRLGEDTSNRLFEHALFHNKNNDYIYVDADDVIGYLVDCDSENLALNSRVTLKDGKNMHIPMLDFELPFSVKNIEVVKNVLDKLKLKGDIFNSGKSFHFIGDALITQDELIDLLAKFSLLYPIADQAWCSHQIIERSASLRVTMKHGIYPKFIEHH